MPERSDWTGETSFENRDLFELWLNKHNRKMEFLRTLGSLSAAVLSGFIFLKVFNII